MKLTSPIVLYQTDAEADKLIEQTLNDYFGRIQVFTQKKDLCRALVNTQEKVFLITADSMADCLATYYRCLDAVADYPICQHRVVAMIPRQDEKEAYQAFRSGVIDDYMVARPVYEVHRPILICEHLLVELGVVFNHNRGDLTFVRNENKYSSDLQTFVSKGVKRKEEIRQAFESTMIEVDKALDMAVFKIRQSQPVELDMDKLKNTLSAIRSDEVRPELLQLQNKAMGLLEQMLNIANPKQEAPSEQPLESAQSSPSPSDQRQVDESPPQEKPAVKKDYVFNRLFSENVDYEQELEKQKASPRILLVEDDAISAQLTTKILNQYKIKVDVVTNGRSAFAALSNRPYSLVLMDITLPDTNGIYIVDQVCNGDGPNKSSPIVILSGKKDKNTVRQAVERGAKGYIVKPLYKDSVEKLFEKFSVNPG